MRLIPAVDLDPVLPLSSGVRALYAAVLDSVIEDLRRARTREDALAWVTSDEPHAFSIYSVAFVLGLDPDALRERLLAGVELGRITYVAGARQQMQRSERGRTRSVRSPLWAA